MRPRSSSRRSRTEVDASIASASTSCSLDVTARPMGDAELTEQLTPASVRGREQCGRPRHQVHRGGHVAALPGADTRVPEARPGVRGQAAGVAVDRPEPARYRYACSRWDPDNLVLRRFLRTEPLGALLVEVRPGAFGDAGVRGLADEGVMGSESHPRGAGATAPARGGLSGRA